MINDEDAFNKELIDMVRAEIRAIRGPTNHYCGVKGAATILGVSESTVRRYVRDGIISCYRLPCARGASQATLLFSKYQMYEDIAWYKV